MKKIKSGPVKTATLRKKAEKRLAGKETNAEPLSGNDTQRLIHELQVHQIELEMQNEELRRALHELEKAHSKIAEFYDFAPIGYFTFDQNGLILEANLTGSKMLGVQRGSLIKKPFSLFIAPEHQDIFYLNCRQTIKTSARQSCEVMLIKKDGTRFHARLESAALEASKKNAARCRIAVIDITEHRQFEQQTSDLETARNAVHVVIAARKKVEGQLTHSKGKFEAIFNAVGDAITFVDTGRLIQLVNPAFTAMFGYTEEEVKGRTPEFLYADKADYEAHSRRRSLAGAATENIKMGPLEVCYRRKDGSCFWAESTGQVVKDAYGTIIGFLGIHRDISERRRIEE